MSMPKLDQYCYVDSRYMRHDGVVIDIGCWRWDWSEQFAGIKKVIGFDAKEEVCPEWATLVRKMVSLSDGNETFNDAYNASSVFAGTKKTFETVSIRTILKDYPSISILKMNVEGDEYRLLGAMEHPVADQLVVSFHDTDWIKDSPFSAKTTKAVVDQLSKWYTPLEIYKQCKWYLFLKR